MIIIELKGGEELPVMGEGDLNFYTPYGVYVAADREWYIGTLGKSAEVTQEALGRSADPLEYGYTYLAGTFTDADGEGPVFTFASVLSNTEAAKKLMKAAHRKLGDYVRVQARCQANLPLYRGKFIEFYSEDYEGDDGL